MSHATRLVFAFHPGIVLPMPTTTITVTDELHEALLIAASMVDDVIAVLDLRAMPYHGEALGDVRDLLHMIASGDLAAITNGTTQEVTQ